MSQSSESKREPPTPRRRREAHRRGQVAKSIELSGSLSLLCSLLCVISLGPWAAQRIAHFSLLVDRTFEALNVATVQIMVVQAIVLVAQLSLIPLAVAALVYVLSLWLQTGSVFSFELIKPQLNRLNPVQGLRRLFSIRSLVQFAFMLLKVGIIAAAGGLVCANVLGDAVRVIYNTDASAALEVANRALMQLLLWCGGLFVLLGLVDLVYQRWQHLRDLRMSFSEVRREQRDDQGNNELKTQRKHFAQEGLPREHLALFHLVSLVVCDSDGRAVALIHQPRNFPLPLYLVRGSAEFAGEILALARRHKVPVVTDSPLLTALYPSVQAGMMIPPKHLGAVVAHINQAAAAAAAAAAASQPQ